MRQLQYRSPAKVNLFLRVLKKREDGFHELASLFHTVDLFDILTFNASASDLFTCTSFKLPLNEKNLVIRALKLFREKTGCHFPLHIHLEKHIPTEAGLGGGSSNAATTLYALNQLAGAPLTNIELIELGSLLGSDVPFFFSSGSAYCTGRGEIIQDVSIPAFTYILHKPHFGSSTPAVFKAFDPSFRSSLDPEILLKSFQENQPIYTNDLEQAAFAVSPALKTFKESLLNKYDAVVMSGSGSAFLSVGVAKGPISSEFTQKVCTITRKEGWY